MSGTINGKVGAQGAPRGSETVTITRITVRVKTDQGSLEPIVLDSSSTVEILKQMIEEKTGIPVQRQCLVLPRSNLNQFNDNQELLGSVLEGNSTLILKDKALISQGAVPERTPGHTFLKTMTHGTDVHQGNRNTGYRGQGIQGMGQHTFETTESTRGALHQGDHYRAGASPGHDEHRDQFHDGPPVRLEQQAVDGLRGPQHDSHQGEDYQSNHRPSMGGPTHAGNRYIHTTTYDTTHRQGNDIYSSFLGPAPVGGGNHQYGETTCEGGSLHQGNIYK